MGLLNTVTIGPLPGWLGLPSVETAESTLTRGAFFVGVGGLTGFLFDRSRAALDGWRTAAITIAAREREAMVALARGAEAKDMVTADHISRVQMLTEELALALAIEPSRASDLGWSAMPHDVGKLHVPDRILLRTDRYLPESGRSCGATQSGALRSLPRAMVLSWCGAWPAGITRTSMVQATRMACATTPSLSKHGSCASPMPSMRYESARLPADTIARRGP